MENLPVELLCRVFLIGAPHYAKSSGNDYDDLLRYRLTITAVDARWREIALSLPLLWREIVVAQDTTQLPDAVDRELSLFSITLARSQHTPVDLTINVITKGWYSDANGAELWSLVSPQLHRCQYLSINSQNQTFPLQGSLEQLVTLECSASHWAPASPWSTGFPLVKNISNLSSLRNVRFARYPDIPPAIVKQLTRLSLSPNTSANGNSPVLFLISQCTSLVYLDATFGFHDAEEEAGISPAVTLDHLEYLGIEPPHMCAFIAAPRLQHLRLGGAIESFEPIVHLFPSLLTLTMQDYTPSPFSARIGPGCYPLPPRAFWDITVLEFTEQKAPSLLLADPSREPVLFSPQIHSTIHPRSFSPPISGEFPLIPRSSPIALRLVRFGSSFTHTQDDNLPTALFAFLETNPQVEVECGIDLHPNVSIRDRARAYGSRLRTAEGKSSETLVGLQLQWGDNLLWTRGADLAGDIGIRHGEHSSYAYT